jgi:cytochrome c-type biogenesis protein CcmF
VIRRGLTDIYVAVNPPMVRGFFNSYHELIIYYLSTYLNGVNGVSSESLSLAALLSAGYNIRSLRGQDHDLAALVVEQGMIDLFLLAESFNPSESLIVSDGIVVSVKIIPGVNLVWVGTSVMVAGGLLSLFYGRRRTEGQHQPLK